METASSLQSKGNEFISRTVHEMAFANKSAQQLLHQWLGTHDRLGATFVDRDTWEHFHKKTPLRNTPGGEKELVLPADVRLWELPKFFEKIEPRKEEVQNHRIDCFKLGTLLQEAAWYLDEYERHITHGRDIYETLRTSFQEYGERLLEQTTDPKKRQSMQERYETYGLDEYRKRKVERWLLGEKVYAQRLAKIDAQPDRIYIEQGNKIEELRAKTVAQFFRIAAKVQERDERGQLAPESTGHAFKQRVEEGMRKGYSAPKEAIFEAAYRRGLQHLREAFDIPIHQEEKDFLERLIQKDVRTLMDQLQPHETRKRLEELRKNGENERAEKLELGFARKLQQLLNRRRYEYSQYSPRKIAEEKTLNCLGSTLVSSALLTEAGIFHVHVRHPVHSTLILSTSNQHLEWFDMTTSTEKPTEDEFESHTDSVDTWNIADQSDVVRAIHDVARGIRTQSVILQFKGHSYTQAMGIETEPTSVDYWRVRANQLDGSIPVPPLIIASPKKGHQNAILQWVASEAQKKNDEEHQAIAMESINLAVQIDPLDEAIACHHGDLLLEKGQYRSSLKAYEKSLTVDPNNPETHRIASEICEKIYDDESKNQPERSAGFLQRAEAHARTQLSLIMEILNAYPKSMIVDPPINREKIEQAAIDARLRLAKLLARQNEIYVVKDIFDKRPLKPFQELHKEQQKEIQERYLDIARFLLATPQTLLETNYAARDIQKCLEEAVWKVIAYSRLRNNYRESLTKLEELLHEHPENIKIDLIIRDFEDEVRFLETNHESPALVADARRLFFEGKYEKCIKQTEYAISRNPRNGEAYPLMVEAYRALKKTNEALTACAKGIYAASNPGFEGPHAKSYAGQLDHQLNELTRSHSKLAA